MRESASTLSGWRVEITLPQGEAAIVHADLDKGRSWYRGEGALLGATQERLEQVWRASLPKSDPEPDYPQYG
jgi:hypothetical protein